MSLLAAWLLAATLAAAVVLLHGAALRLIAGPAMRRRCGPGGFGTVAAVLALLAVHVAEIWLYAGGIYLAHRGLGLGGLDGPAFTGGLLDYVYFSAVNYTSLGYGDVSPTEGLRILATFEALLGLLMIGWSTAFTFLLMRRRLPDEPSG